jgi:hypothetical protein
MNWPPLELKGKRQPETDSRGELELEAWGFQGKRSQEPGQGRAMQSQALREVSEIRREVDLSEKSEKSNSRCVTFGDIGCSACAVTDYKTHISEKDTPKSESQDLFRSASPMTSVHVNKSDGNPCDRSPPSK